jgi:hypothetical protein
VSALIQVARSLRSLPGCTNLLVDLNTDVDVEMMPSALANRGGAPDIFFSMGSGPKFGQLDIKIASVAAGTGLGQATYQFALNGGAYSSAAATTGSPIAVGNGWTFWFPSATYSTAYSWRTGNSLVYNQAATNIVRPYATGSGMGYIVGAHAGLPALESDTSTVVSGYGFGGQLQDPYSCTPSTATVDAPYSAIWVCKITSTASCTWSMGAQNVSDGSTFAFGGNGPSVKHARRAGSTSLQTVTLWSAYDGNWHVYAARYNGTQIEFWVDAVKVCPYTTIASTGTKDMSNANMLRIGASYDDTPGPGQWQHFAMYQGLLTDYELAVATRAVQERYRFV